MTATPGIRDPEAPLGTDLRVTDLVTLDLTPDTTITPLRVQVAPPQALELRHIIQALVAHLHRVRATPTIPQELGPAPLELLTTPHTQEPLLDPLDLLDRVLHKDTRVMDLRPAGIQLMVRPPPATQTTEAGAEDTQVRGRDILAPVPREAPSLQYRAHPQEPHRRGLLPPPSRHTRDTRRAVAMDPRRVPPSPAVRVLVTAPQVPQVTPGLQDP